MKWRDEEDLKKWLVRVLDGAWLVSQSFGVGDMGRIKILGMNSNGEKGGSRRFPVRRIDGKVVYPDIVGVVLEPEREGHYGVRPFYVEVHHNKTKLKHNTDTLLQALQYKGKELFERWATPVVVVTDDLFLTGMYKRHNWHMLLERMAWRLGLAVLRRNGYNDLVITMGEQHKWRVVRP